MEMAAILYKFGVNKLIFIIVNVMPSSCSQTFPFDSRANIHIMIGTKLDVIIVSPLIKCLHLNRVLHVYIAYMFVVICK